MKIISKFAPKSKPKAEPEQPIDKTFGLGSVIKSARESRGLSQAQLATRCDVERTTITNLEAGRQTLMIAVAVKIFEVLDYDFQISVKPKEIKES
jgi:transcriptional regulator with XRE-family HTH domain